LSRIVKATQSPMNARRWLVELECGHETWITSHVRPRRQVSCDECRKVSQDIQERDARRKTHAKP
jgi:hypothetical protein